MFTRLNNLVQLAPLTEWEILIFRSNNMWKSYPTTITRLHEWWNGCIIYVYEYSTQHVLLPTVMAVKILKFKSFTSMISPKYVCYVKIWHRYYLQTIYPPSAALYLEVEDITIKKYMVAIFTLFNELIYPCTLYDQSWYFCCTVPWGESGNKAKPIWSPPGNNWTTGRRMNIHTCMRNQYLKYSH